MQVYGAMRKLALEQQAETAQLNAAVQQSGDKEDEDPDLDEDEADAKQVPVSWVAEWGCAMQDCPQLFGSFLVCFWKTSGLDFPCPSLGSLPGLCAGQTPQTWAREV